MLPIALLKTHLHRFLCYILVNEYTFKLQRHLATDTLSSLCISVFNPSFFLCSFVQAVGEAEWRSEIIIIANSKDIHFY